MIIVQVRTHSNNNLLWFTYKPSEDIFTFSNTQYGISYFAYKKKCKILSIVYIMSAYKSVMAKIEIKVGG